MILVSLPNQNLDTLAGALKEKYGVDVYYFEIDLSISQNILRLTNWLNDNFNVHMLINNAGIGGSKKFTDVEATYIEKIIQVNVIATSLLTHQLLPNLMKFKSSYVLNVSSIAAFTPLGYKTVYPATKTYIDSFSRGLSAELKGANVTVSVVHPGAMNTNEDARKRIEQQGFLAKLTLLNTDKVARHCIKRLLKKDAVIVVNPFSWFFSKLIPVRITLPLITKKIKQEVEQ